MRRSGLAFPDVCEACTMQNSRIPVPRCKADAPIIEAFQCSRCEWEYVLRKPVPDVVAYDEVARAAWRFDAHRCALYWPRGDASTDGTGWARRIARFSPPRA